MRLSCSTDSMVGSTLDTSRLNIFIDSLESFLPKYAPQRAYSKVLGTMRPTSMMKAFVAPPRPPPLCAWIGLDYLSLVGLDWLGVSAITVYSEAASGSLVAALGLHQSYPKWLELFQLVLGWKSSSTFSFLPSEEELFRGQSMESHPKVTTSPQFHFFILHSSSAKLMIFLPWTSIWSFLNRTISASN